MYVYNYPSLKISNTDSVSPLTPLTYSFTPLRHYENLSSSLQSVHQSLFHLINLCFLNCHSSSSQLPSSHCCLCEFHSRLVAVFFFFTVLNLYGLAIYIVNPYGHTNYQSVWSLQIANSYRFNTMEKNVHFMKYLLLVGLNCRQKIENCNQYLVVNEFVLY